MVLAIGTAWIGSQTHCIGLESMTSITPWSPYLDRTVVTDGARTTLVEAFSDLVRARHDFERHELPDIFAATSDDGENDLCRTMIALDAERLAAQFIGGGIATFARPLGGGEVVTIEPSLWEIDDPLPRFATGALNLVHWADPEAPATHRIWSRPGRWCRL